MIGTTLIANALQLPSEDWQALIQGRMITALPWNFIPVGHSFALFPEANGIDPQLKVRFWAKCESCQSIDSNESLDVLSKLTIWTKQALEAKLEERGFFFLAYLRVYEMPEPASIVAVKKGAFLPLQQPISVSNPLPVLSDRAFTKRKRQIETLEPPLHPELEALHDTIAHLATINSQAKPLEQDLKALLGWSKYPSEQTNLDLGWIEQIAEVGNSSDGDYFEKLIRKSFIELGFSNSLNNPKVSLDPNATGGAGGIDFCCDFPYLIIGECKASKDKRINDNKDGAPAQLIKHGNNYLRDRFEQCIKIIAAPGELSTYAKETAIGNKMNVLTPETIQRLVKLKKYYPSAVNLWELEPWLKEPPFGQEADKAVNQYIDEVLATLKLRSQIIQAVKELAEHEPQKEFITTEIRVHHNARFTPRLETDQIVKEILIELSSPLAGYLGRKKGTEGDRFYFLRNLVLNDLS